MAKIELKVGEIKEYKTDKDIDYQTRRRLCVALCGIRSRCLNPDNQSFYLYGGRGITVCDEWQGKDGHKNFREWAVNNGYQKGLSIDGIDNNKGYSPENCRWVTAKEQGNNRRTNKLVTIHGKTKNVTEWAEELGISVGAFQNRLRYGWDEDKLLQPKQVHLKMSKHELRVEVLKLRKQVDEYKSQIESGELVRLPCKIGDMVYGVGFNDCEENYTGIPEGCKGHCYDCKYVRHKIEEYVCAFIEITSDGVEVVGENMATYPPDRVCTSRAQAEAKLTEITNGKRS